MYLAGVVEGLLLARLVTLLFAGRPDNPVWELLWAVTWPLVWPWSALDRWAGQPRFGARLELASLAAMASVALLALALAIYGNASRSVRKDHHV
ncbi:MAG TPA: hypothetical protein VLA19_05830 [Herpetosiphonaceae bacterium]|nr:hypothetical protein [Herpetosiphonaceae bacterium]